MLRCLSYRGFLDFALSYRFDLEDIFSYAQIFVYARDRVLRWPAGVFARVAGVMSGYSIFREFSIMSSYDRWKGLIY